MPLSLYDLNISKASINVVDTINNGLMSIADKTKLDGIAANATNVATSLTNGSIKINGTDKTVYTHPSTHAATMIVDDSTHRFVTDAQIATWNGKANTTTATQTADGLLSAADKLKLDGITSGATAVASSAVNGNIKINGAETAVYAHPLTHAATMIVDDSTHRFCTDTEKATWNGKANKSGDTFTGAVTISNDLTVNRILSKYTTYSATGDGGACIVNSNEATYQALMIVGNNSKGDGIRRVKLWDEVTVTGNLIASGNITMSATGVLYHGNSTVIDSAGKVWGAVYNDLAEGFRAYDINEIEPGDVLEQTPTGVRKSSSFASNKVVGVYSDTYGFCLGINGEEEIKKFNLAPVGLCGKVNVKVNGTAKIGDLLVASNIPGVAVVNNDAKLGTVIGKVLQDKNTTNTERISMLILNI